MANLESENVMARSFKWVDIIFNSEILMYKALFNNFGIFREENI